MATTLKRASSDRRRHTLPSHPSHRHTLPTATPFPPPHRSSVRGSFERYVAELQEAKRSHHTSPFPGRPAFKAGSTPPCVQPKSRIRETAEFGSRLVTACLVRCQPDCHEFPSTPPLPRVLAAPRDMSSSRSRTTCAPSARESSTTSRSTAAPRSVSVPAARPLRSTRRRRSRHSVRRASRNQVRGHRAIWSLRSIRVIRSDSRVTPS